VINKKKEAEKKAAAEKEVHGTFGQITEAGNRGTLRNSSRNIPAVLRDTATHHIEAVDSSSPSVLQGPLVQNAHHASIKQHREGISTALPTPLQKPLVPTRAITSMVWDTNIRSGTHINSPSCNRAKSL